MYVDLFYFYKYKLRMMYNEWGHICDTYDNEWWIHNCTRNVRHQISRPDSFFKASFQYETKTNKDTCVLDPQMCCIGVTSVIL